MTNIDMIAKIASDLLNFLALLTARKDKEKWHTYSIMDASKCGMSTSLSQARMS